MHCANLASALAHARAGRLADAGEVCKELLRQAPNDPIALHLSGMLACEAGRLDEALSLIQRAVEFRPESAQFLANLGAVLGRMGRHDEVLPHLREAARLGPNSPESHNNLGAALLEVGSVDESVTCFGRALALRPAYADAHANLGRALVRLGQLALGAASLERAIQLAPASVGAYQDLTLALCEQGRLAEALSYYRKALLLPKASASLHSGYLFVLHYDPSIGPEAMYEEHRKWAARHAAMLYPPPGRHGNDPNPDRRIRVGYVSADFREHPVARSFQEPVLAHHDHARFEVICYKDSIKEDATTRRLRAMADTWRETARLSDDELAGQIRCDRIDILVDLAGHSAGNRLLVFARKPAPVQVTCIGYIDTTGLATMDYRLTDALHDPPAAKDRFHTEALIRLPGCIWCYHPGENDPPVRPMPAGRNGFVTFGCFNKPVKVTEKTLRLWAQVLATVEGTRLMLPIPTCQSTQAAFRARLERFGIPTERLVTPPRVPGAQYMSRFGEVDICLDPFPYNGVTTTCDSLWMGVPVVALAGSTHISRAGVSILTSVGLEELAAPTEAEYVKTAVDLARDLPRLARLRAGLRERMRNSPLLDATRYARAVEEAYRGMWQTWCRGVR
ncbi:MAG TPA: tetratricopeptide repeat protein [Tepidisphaeraceae bacterium]|nr:tetratricopeptide repeat protein [Tepidisphaeraceae bacterium]